MEAHKICYASDAVLFSECEDDLQRHVEIDKHRTNNFLKHIIL